MNEDEREEAYLRLNCFMEARKLRPYRSAEALVKDAQCIERYVKNQSPCSVFYLISKEEKV